MEYNIKIETLSPVHIGTDNAKFWIQGLDYIIKDGKVYIIDTDKLFMSSKIDINQVSAHIANGNTDAFQNIISKDLKNYTRKIFNLPVRSLSFREIRTNINNSLSGRPIMPGSSLKGAVNSAIFDYLTNFSSQNIKALINNQQMFKDKIKEVYGSPERGNAFMRFIKISDIEFESTGLINTKVYNLLSLGDANFKGGWKKVKKGLTEKKYSDNGFNTVYEAIMPHQIATGRIIIDDSLFAKISHGYAPLDKKKKDLLSMSGNSSIFSVINAYTCEYIYREKDFFEKYGGEFSSDILKVFNDLLYEIPEENKDDSACVLRMSAGSGFHAITGDWMLENHLITEIQNKANGTTRGRCNGLNSAKSRKIAVWEENDKKIFSPMGFVKITLL